MNIFPNAECRMHFAESDWCRVGFVCALVRRWVCMVPVLVWRGFGGFLGAGRCEGCGSFLSAVFGLIEVLVAGVLPG